MKQEVSFNFVNCDVVNLFLLLVVTVRDIVESEIPSKPAPFARSISAYVTKHKIEGTNIIFRLWLSAFYLFLLPLSSLYKFFLFSEQKLIESCFKSCYEMVQCVCEWYISGRDRDKTGVLCAASAFLKDFGDFPIYCYEEKESDALCDHYSSSSVQIPKWVVQLLKVIDVESWKAGHVSDFDVRSRIVDLLIFLYIRSYILIDQHLALQGRESNDDYLKTTWASTKSTTTVLLKPMLCNSDIKILDSSNIFQVCFFYSFVFYRSCF